MEVGSTGRVLFAQFDRVTDPPSPTTLDSLVAIAAVLVVFRRNTFLAASRLKAETQRCPRARIGYDGLINAVFQGSVLVL